MKCKCKDCKKRKVGCHSTCEDYIRFVNEYRNMMYKVKLDKNTSTSSGWSYTGKRKKTND